MQDPGINGATVAPTSIIVCRPCCYWRSWEIKIYKSFGLLSTAVHAKFSGIWSHSL